MAEQKTGLVSIVIAVCDEQETLAELYRRIVANVAPLAEAYEILFVDDGSRDGSAEVIRELCAADDNVRLISFAVNYGKATALDTGLGHAHGEIVITLDADLQDDPDEIPSFVSKLRQGYDLVSGWKKVRHDPWHKTVPSRLFNAVVARVSGVRLHDFNCGFKAYTGQTARNLSLYGELHRYIPVLVHSMGGRIAEIPVRHHPRRHGSSKYGLERLPKGLFDLITILVTTRFLKRPLHFFGSIGFGAFLLGSAALVYLAVLWLLGYRPIGNRPLLLYGMLMALGGVQLFSFGVLAELMIRFSHRNERPLIKEEIGVSPAGSSHRPEHDPP